jgi:dTDP-glucose 4,6-dehydratase
MLVTGSAGFIGSHFVRAELASDPNVRIVSLDALTYAGDRARLANLPPVDERRHLFVHGDITDGALVRQLLGEHDIDTIVNFAAESHVDRSIDGPARFVHTNVVGTSVLLDAARDLWLGSRESDRRNRDRARTVRFHQISTDEVFGSLRDGDAPFHEASPYAPSSPYSASKAAGDHLVRAFHQTYGLPTLLTHASNNFGPGQHAEKLIPTIVRACLGETPIPIYGDGSNRRDWIFVGDHVRALSLALRGATDGSSYTIGGGDDSERSNLAVAHLICRTMDELRPESAPHERRITFVQDRPGHDWRYAVSSARMRRDFGWTASEPFELSLRRTIEAVVEQP